MRNLLYACRILRQRPVFSLVAVVTLALGIGVNSAIFSVVDAVMLRPLPFADAARLASVWPDRSFSKQELLFLRHTGRSYAQLGFWSGGWSFALTGRDQPLELPGARATADFFSLLGARAAIGRTFAPGEDLPGNDRVAVLSDGLWRRLFAASPAALGQRLELDGEPYTVVGVMPSAFKFLDNATEIWLPATLDSQGADFKARFAGLFGRLRPGVSLGAASAELASLAPLMRRRFDEREEPGIPKVVALQTRLTGRFERTAFLLAAAVLFVLLVACAGVAHLQLARVVERDQEIAIRTALGARPRQLLAQLLAESALLALAGGACGLLLAAWAVRVLVANLPPQTPRLAEIAVNGRVLAFSVLVSLLTAIASGLAPALRSLRTDPHPALRAGGRTTAAGPRRDWLGRALVMLQVGVALVLSIGAGLMVKSLWRLQRVDPGFRQENLLTLRLTPPSASRYGSLPQIVAFYDQVLGRIQQLPGVVSVAAAQSRPLGSDTWNADLTVEGEPGGAPKTPLSPDWSAVTPAYFGALGVPLLAGRTFTAADRVGAQPVAIVNQTLARSAWPGESPLGKRVYTQLEGRDHWVTVVGVVGDVKQRSLAEAIHPALYRPHAQFDRYPRSALTVLVRTRSNPQRVVAAVRSQVWAVDHDVPIGKIETMESAIYDSIGGPRLVMRLLAAFANLALILGAMSLYGIVSYSVSRRVREIGLRMALGARRSDVLGLVVGQAMKLVLLGLLAGLAAALGLTRLLQSQLFEVGAGDPVTFCTATLLLLAVALLASALPAYRAAQADPLRALQHE
jgi:putative ABC transport system permease protein